MSKVGCSPTLIRVPYPKESSICAGPKEKRTPKPLEQMSKSLSTPFIIYFTMHPKYQRPPPLGWEGSAQELGTYSMGLLRGDSQRASRWCSSFVSLQPQATQSKRQTAFLGHSAFAA